MEGLSYLYQIFLVVFLLLFLTNRRFHFYVKVFTHYSIIFVSTLLPIPIAIFWPRHVRNTNICAFICTNLSKIFANTYEIRGLEHISKDESAVIACNHQSSLDAITMMHLWPKIPKCAPIVKKELIYTGTIGIFMWLCGAVFIDRSNPTRAKEALNYQLKYLTDKKIKIWFFPEGTRNDSGTMLPFKKGAFHLAIQAQRPILPITFSSYSSFYNKRIQKFDNGGKVIVNILPPVPTEGLKAEDVTTLMETVHGKMVESLSNITKEVEVYAENKKSQ